MPPRRKKPSGLTEEDVARLRGQLSEGRRPRVALSGPQFETGASGSVVRIGDPAVDGADFLTVRVKVNGVTDELAFAPAELSIGMAGSAAGSGSAAASGSAAGSAGGRARARQPRAADTAAPSSPAPPAARRSSPSPVAPSESREPSAERPGSAGASATPSQPALPARVVDPAPADAGTKPAHRRRKPPATPVVNVTISSSGASWSVSASRGTRTIVKNASVAPGVVTAIADLLDQAGLSEAVAEINETARSQAEQRAQELRAELSDLEAVLAAHRTPR